MKKIQLIINTLILSIYLAYAGGDITAVTPYETDDISMATDEATMYVEPSIVPTPTPMPVKEVVEDVKPKKRDKVVPNGFYTALGISGFNYSSNCDCSSDTTKDGGGEDKVDVALLARVGYSFNQYLALEARGLRSISSEEGFKVSSVGLFLKPTVPINKQLNFYGLVGFAKTDVDSSRLNSDVEGFSYGAGFEYDLSEDTPKDAKYSRDFDGKGDQERGLGVFIDYQKPMVKDSAPDLDIVTAGVTYDF